jgi:uroporphyrinogen-III decarboxylase
MDRNFYLDLGKAGTGFPIGTDLIVHEYQDPEKLKLDGILLGKAVERAAKRFYSPMAFPLMDLKIEKVFLLETMGISPMKTDEYHFDSEPSDELIESIKAKIVVHSNTRVNATCEAISYIAKNTGLLPVGMCIGPFSLMTKLVHDPITPIYLSGMGINHDDDDSISTTLKCLRLSVEVIKNYILRQANAGAKAIIMCEPAANKIYISPTQIESGSNVFTQCVTKYLLEIKKLLDSLNIDLIFHNCGELTDYMVREFVSLDPVILSLGSSRILWEDAKIIPKNIVLYGNLPSKYFYSDEKITVQAVLEMSKQLIEKMKQANHPFILGSECDVLSVPEANNKINAKVNAFVSQCCLARIP